MPHVVTIAERKSREAARRSAAVRAMMLREYALAHRGRFLVFGSAAQGRLRYDSDFDVIVDFASEAEPAAVEYVEALCREHGVPADVHAKSSTRAEFIERILPMALVLP